MRICRRKLHLIALITMGAFVYWIGTRILPRTHPVVNLTLTELPLSTKPLSHSSHITLVVVCCGNRFQETVVMIKSAVLFTPVPFRVIVITEENLVNSFEAEFLKWPDTVRRRTDFDIRLLDFPEKELGGADMVARWKKFFKPCAMQRLLLPVVLRDVDSILYVDTDTIFITSLEVVWKHFSAMGDSQLAAMTPEHEEFATGWYNRFALHPFVRPLGVNSGVMLMNFTRIRAAQNKLWMVEMMEIFKEYKLKITFGDQDILNIYFNFHPERLLVIPCQFNYRPDHCMYTSVCKSAEEGGVLVLHGNRAVFHKNGTGRVQPAFSAVYSVFRDYDLCGDFEVGVIGVLEANSRVVRGLDHCWVTFQFCLRTLRNMTSFPSLC